MRARIFCKEFRLEALRAGFKDAWSHKDYQTIIKAAQKIPQEALYEDEKLLLVRPSADENEAKVHGQNRRLSRAEFPGAA